MNTTTKTTAINTLDVQACHWFDKINGNSYFSAEVIINYGTDQVDSFILPFQYGYGPQYEYETLHELVKRGYIADCKPYSLYTYCKDNDIILRSSIVTSKKRDLHEA